MRESLIHLAEREFTRAQLVDEAWRLAGNIERLQAYQATPPWNRQIVDEYVPVQVIGVTKEERGVHLYVGLALRILAGTSAPRVIQQAWSIKFCRMLSRSLGFAKPWAEEDRYDDPRQLFGLRFYALMEQRLCTTVPVFEKVWMDDEGRRIKPNACYDHNRQLIKLRNRTFSKFDCPAKLPVTVTCHNCVVGLSDCPLAVHDKTYFKRKCRFCGKETWFNPQLTKRMCISCYDRQIKGELL